MKKVIVGLRCDESVVETNLLFLINQINEMSESPHNQHQPITHEVRRLENKVVLIVENGSTVESNDLETIRALICLYFHIWKIMRGDWTEMDDYWFDYDATSVNYQIFSELGFDTTLIENSRLVINLNTCDLTHSTCV
jgi:hypothetical protein